MDFEWDPKKVLLNLKKHGLSFREATSVFADDFARIIDDPVHSLSEHREIIIGTYSGADCCSNRSLFGPVEQELSAQGVQIK